MEIADLEYRDMLRHVDDSLDTKLISDLRKNVKEYLGTFRLYAYYRSICCLASQW